MHAHVRKWGNSPSLRIPASVMAAAGLRVDQLVDIRVEQGRMIVEPATPAFDLSSAIEAITPSNAHGEVDLGDGAGAEHW